METTESIKSLNLQLINEYGIDSITGRAIWRIVFSEDQYEKRLGTYDDYTPGGIYIRTVTEVREVPKYKQWIHEKYLLERLVIVPEQNQDELPVSKLSYEPIFVFENRGGEYLPPKFEICKIVVDTIYAAQGKKSLAKYKDPEANKEESLALRRMRIDNIMEELFGDETDIGDALTYKEGIIVPGGGNISN
jgi:hypothetical protein